jgi:hypothetical protein
VIGTLDADAETLECVRAARRCGRALLRGSARTNEQQVMPVSTESRCSVGFVAYGFCASEH